MPKNTDLVKKNLALVTLAGSTESKSMIPWLEPRWQRVAVILCDIPPHSQMSNAIDRRPLTPLWLTNNKHWPDFQPITIAASVGALSTADHCWCTAALLLVNTTALGVRDKAKSQF